MSDADLVAAMTRSGMGWRWVGLDDGRRITDVRVEHDGERLTVLRWEGDAGRDEVVAGLIGALIRRRERRSKAARKGAVTRAKRRELLVYDVARQIRSNRFVPGCRCAICGRALSDSDSRDRGVGPECWGDVLRLVQHFAEASHGA